jgi:hypothetical protein
MNRAPVPRSPALTRDNVTSQGEAQASLEDYRTTLTVNAREHGLAGARLADPDGHDLAVAAVRDAAAKFGSFSADDVFFPGSRTTLGTAFSSLRKSGEIECCGCAVSRRPVAHSRLVRVWRAT